MLTGIHILLTFMCNEACDHCFVFSGPNAKGTFTLSQLRTVLDEATKLGTIEWVYFEGGEPFLFYPTMIEGMRIARSKGLKVGLVTNAYYATSEEDAELWLREVLSFWPKNTTWSIRVSMLMPVISATFSVWPY